MQDDVHNDTHLIVRVAASNEQAQKSPQQTPIVINITKTRRSEEHTSELQSLMRISYAVFCLKKKKKTKKNNKKNNIKNIKRYQKSIEKQKQKARGIKDALETRISLD